MSKKEIYKDKKWEWRWKIIADNGRIILETSEGYKNKSHAKEMLDKYGK